MTKARTQLATAVLAAISTLAIVSCTGVLAAPAYAANSEGSIFVYKR